MKNTTTRCRNCLRLRCAPSSTFPKQGKSNGFTNGSAQQNVGELLAEAYFEAAEAVAADVIRDIPVLLDCNVTSVGQAECGRRFVVKLTTAAFRRTPTATELAAYQQLLTQATTQFTFNDALEVVVSAVLQSPHFLYHVERGVEAKPGLVKLDGSSVAARLATALWQALPDEALVTAANRGELNEVAGIEAQARRMVAHPKAKPVLVRLYSEMTRADELLQVPKTWPGLPTRSLLCARPWPKRIDAFSKAYSSALRPPSRPSLRLGTPS